MSLRSITKDGFEFHELPPYRLPVFGNQRVLIYAHPKVKPTLREVISYAKLGNSTEISRMIVQNALSVNGVKLTSLDQREMEFDLTRPEGNKINIGKEHEILIFAYDF